MINFEKKIPTPKIQSQIKSGRAIPYQNPASQEILSIFWYGFCFRFTFLLLVSPANWKIKLWSAKTDFYVLWPHFMENTESKGSFTYAFYYWMDFHLVWRCANFLLEMTAFYPTLWNGQYDTKKDIDEKGWYQGQRSPKVTIFCVCKHIVKMLPLTKFQLIWSKIVHFRGKWKICPILKEKWAIFQPNDTEVVLTFLGQIEPWYFKA